MRNREARARTAAGALSIAFAAAALGEELPAFGAPGGWCGTTEIRLPEPDQLRGPARSHRGLFIPHPGHCDDDTTFPHEFYDPILGTDSDTGFLIDVWVHFLIHSEGHGNLPDQRAHEQIGVLNEDFRALAGSNGADGYASRIYFRLAGITRTFNDAWYNDDQSVEPDYWDVLSVDPTRNLNIYVNAAGGLAGYHFGLPGTIEDRVNIFPLAFGLNPTNPPADLGRVTTHEVGHYFSLGHTFSECNDPMRGCNGSGDTLCDTAPHVIADTGCTETLSTCDGFPFNPIDNYMNYTDDLCKRRFTVEGVRRMRCNLWHYRNFFPLILFFDGFEHGATTGWSTSSP